MKKLSYIISCFLVFCCVACSKHVIDNTSLMAYEYDYTAQQVDSVCHVENISCCLDDWTQSTYVDYETNTVIKQYYYIVEENEKIRYIYKLTLKGEDIIYKYTKMIFKND